MAERDKVNPDSWWLMRPLSVLRERSLFTVFQVFYFPSSPSHILRCKITGDGWAFPFNGVSEAQFMYLFSSRCSLWAALNILFSSQPTRLISAKCFNSIEKKAFCISRAFVSEPSHETTKLKRKKKKPSRKNIRPSPPWSWMLWESRLGEKKIRVFCNQLCGAAAAIPDTVLKSS